MEISEKLAIEIYTILIFHIIAILLLVGFTTLLFLKSKKSPLLYSYLTVVAMIVLWMVSKILKTVSPNQSIRWFFISLQYFGIQFLGYFLLIFSFIYRKNKLPKGRILFLLSLPPIFCYLIVITNPIHMMFYSYYDFYKDKFGSLFLPVQSIQYIYLLISIILLSKNFTKQDSLKHNPIMSKVFSLLIVFSVSFNVYYILFKMTSMPWIFPFPVFDFTPISSTMALIFFTIPAFQYRFFDILPISYQCIYNSIPQGIAYLDHCCNLQNYNQSVIDMLSVSFTQPYSNINLSTLLEHKSFVLSADQLISDDKTSTILQMNHDKYIKIKKLSGYSKKSYILICDITEVIKLNDELMLKNENLAHTNSKLMLLADATRELAITRTKTVIAQNMHDILGHTFTIALGNLSLMENENNLLNNKLMLSQIEELLMNCLSDMTNTLNGNYFSTEQNSLVKAINSLSNQNINLDFVTQGNVYELNTQKTETIYRLCQEAMTNTIRHSNAQNLHVILRYHPDEVEIYIIDDGVGCLSIHKGYGLNGIEKRISEINGTVTFGSDGNKGFHIHAKIPSN